MQGFVRCQARRHFGQVFAAKGRNHAQIGVNGTQFQARGQIQHIPLVAQGVGFEGHGVVGQLFLHHRHAAHFLDGGDQRVAVRLVVALELHGNVQHRFLQQPTAGTQLVGVDGLVFQPQCHVQDTDIFAHVTLHALRQRIFAGQQGDCHSRQSACAAHEAAT